MHTSLRQSTLRQVMNNRTTSNDGIRINHEVSVVSSRPEVPQRPTVSYSMRSMSDGIFRASSTHHAHERPTRPILRSNQTTDAVRERPRMTKRLMSRDAEALERDRQSMREVAAFLRTKEPPPDHWMSIPESSGPSHPSRKLPFRIFHRHRNEKSLTSPRPLKLPDSAVAAKTIEGHWHIAISIPVEYDHPDSAQNLGDPPSQTSEGPAIATTRERPITVPKPSVLEGQQTIPPKSGLKNTYNRPSTIRQVSSEHISASSRNILDSEAASTLREYYRQVILQESSRKPSSSTPEGLHSDPRDIQRSSDTASPDNIRRQHSHGSDPRHSGGTAYSEMSLDTEFGHSRGQSSVSTVPSPNQYVSLRGIEPPTRFSSVPKTTEEGDPAQLTAHPPSTQQRSYHQARPSVQSVASFKSDVSSAVVNTADTADPSSSLESCLAQTVPTPNRKAPRFPGPAPNRKLPDLPEGSDDGHGSRYPLSSTDHNGSTVRSELVESKEPAKAGLRPTRQSRQERVKALRSRDMAAFKAKAGMQQPPETSDSKDGRARGTRAAPPAQMRASSSSSRHVKRQSLSSSPSHRERLNNKNGNALTAMMIVADLEPYPEILHSDVIGFSAGSHSRKTESSNNNGGSQNRTHTPPRSLTPSLASSDEENGHTVRGGTLRNSPAEADLPASNTTQQQKLLRHEGLLKEDELDNRLKRIEKTNEMMLQALNAVLQMGVGFQEVIKLLNSKAADPNDDDFPRTSAMQPVKGLDTIEPLMRELQMAARISQETGREGDEHDDYDFLTM